jgi:hypothetical protein
MKKKKMSMKSLDFEHDYIMPLKIIANKISTFEILLKMYLGV